MPVTLEDIARMSGVSRSTVSRVINGHPHVSEDARIRVEEVIERIDFHPNLAARGLATGRTTVLGLVIPRAVTSIFSDPYFPLVIQGVSSACNALGYSVMLWLAEPEYERRTIGQILHNRLIDGVIVSSMSMDDPLIMCLLESDRPFVTIGRHPTEEKVNYIDVDNRGGSYRAVMYALDKGHRRIAMVKGLKDAIASHDRYEGYMDALRERGLPILPELVEEGQFSDSGGYQAMKRLLQHAPDAVFVASDMMAFACMRAIREAGLRIPEDIAVVGFDDIPASATSSPSLTTVRQPIERTGSMAVETLTQLIEHPGSEPRRVVLATELVGRESC